MAQKVSKKAEEKSQEHDVKTGGKIQELLSSKKEINNWDFFYAILAIVFTFMAIGFVYTALTLQGSVPEESRLPSLCGECQYLSGGSCVDYDCCKDEDCWGSQKCVDNKCEEITCPAGHKVFYHACIPAPGEPGTPEEPLNESDGEQANETVTPECAVNTNCSLTQTCVNGSCTELSCEKGFVPKEHKCVPTVCSKSKECSENSVCVNSTCMKLNCGECQHATDHKCVDYECCEDADCQINYVCSDNSCVLKECGSDEYLRVGMCTKYACISDANCSDNIAGTIDSCQNPATPEAKCVHQWKELNFTASSTNTTITLHLYQEAFSRHMDTRINLTELWKMDAFFDVSLNGRHRREDLWVGRYQSSNYTVGSDVMFVAVSSIDYSGKKVTIKVWYA